MTYQRDVAGGRDIVARWCSLAERRLEYLTELFETGRWRRYHSELAFLENIQEAKAAVETWRDLSRREASLNNSALDMSWLGRTMASGEESRDRVHRLSPQPKEIPAEPLPSMISIVPATELACSGEALSAPAIDDALELTPEMAGIAERYPLLHNAL
jgi:hypothetical protein